MKNQLQPRADWQRINQSDGVENPTTVSLRYGENKTDRVRVWTNKAGGLGPLSEKRKQWYGLVKPRFDGKYYKPSE